MDNSAVKGDAHERKEKVYYGNKLIRRNLKIATGKTTAVSPSVFRNFLLSSRNIV
jgi:hypothetical protein